MSAKVTIGWAGRDITPRCPVSLRGQFNLRIATHVRDPLTLTALALDNGEDQAIIVSVDSCAGDDEIVERCREILGEKLPGFDPNKLFASGTHTHTAPFAGTLLGLQKDEDYMDAIRARYPDYMTTAEYSDLLIEAMVSAAVEAWENRAPGFVTWGYSYAVVGENRRVRYFDDRAVMYGSTGAPDFSHIEGHVDHGVHMLFTYAPDKTLTGALVNVACPSQASESGQDYVSADFWHDTREEIRQRFGRDIFILPQCSAAGDQSPHRQIDRRAEDRMMLLKHNSGLSNSDNTGLRRDIARRIADAVEDAEAAVRQELHDILPISHEYKTLNLPHWDVTEEEYTALQAQIAELSAQLESLGEADPLSSQFTALRSKIAWCQRAVDRYNEPLSSIPIRINIMRIGDAAFVTSPFEYYLDFGDRIKGRSAAVQTFVVQLVGGGSYLPTERAAAGLSYGAVPASCRVSPQGGQVIVDEAVAAIASMFAGEAAGTERQ